MSLAHHNRRRCRLTESDFIGLPVWAWTDGKEGSLYLGKIGFPTREAGGFDRVLIGSIYLDMRSA